MCSMYQYVTRAGNNISDIFLKISHYYNSCFLFTEISFDISVFVFRHSRENGNISFPSYFSLLDSHLRGNDIEVFDFLLSHYPLFLFACDSQLETFLSLHYILYTRYCLSYTLNAVCSKLFFNFKF